MPGGPRKRALDDLQQPWQDRRPPAFVQASFRTFNCRTRPSRVRCTRSSAQGRNVWYMPAPNTRRSWQPGAGSAQIRIIGFILSGKASRGPSQGIRAFGLRRARYRGLVKTGLQTVATAAAINLDRRAV